MPRLFLDDERDPPGHGVGWVVVRSVADAIAWIEQHGCPDFIAFDHDLGADEQGRPLPTGFDLAKWLSSQDLDSGLIPEGFAFYVHSMNSGGGKANIEGLMNAHLAYRQGELAAGRVWPPAPPLEAWGFKVP